MASTIPEPARAFVRAVIQAIDTVTSRDEAGYAAAIAQLTTQPAGGRVLGDVLRSLLEDTHPDGFDSDDITLVIGRCYRTAAAWLAPDRVDVTMLLAVLAGALGINEVAITHESLDLPPADADGRVPVQAPTWPDYAWHAPLLVADLLPYAPATLGGYLEATFAEYAREAREEPP
jgi:hypothetical protein